MSPDTVYVESSNSPSYNEISDIWKTSSEKQKEIIKFSF